MINITHREERKGVWIYHSFERKSNFFVGISDWHSEVCLTGSDGKLGLRGVCSMAGLRNSHLQYEGWTLSEIEKRMVHPEVVFITA